MRIQIGQRPDHGFDEPLGLLSDCHRRIEYFLGVLVAINEQASDRPLKPVERTQLGAALTYFATAGPRHTADEEESLFPRLREFNDPAALGALEVMARLESDHQEADAHHRAIDELVGRWIANEPFDADDRRVLAERLRALQAIYHQHIAIEDRELFPAAGRLLSAEQLEAIGREMAARRQR